MFEYIYKKNIIIIILFLTSIGIFTLFLRFIEVHANKVETFSSNDFVVKEGVLTEYKGNNEVVIIPKNVRAIGHSVFLGNNNITSVIIPKSVDSIESMAFFNCSRLEHIEIPKTVKNIGPDAFSVTPWLEARQKDNPIVVINGILIDGSKCIGNINLPDTVKIINAAAFTYSQELISISIPSSVTYIGDGAFFYCSKLREVEMKNSVKYIGSGAFSKCRSLSKIKLSKSITIINESTFIGCRKLDKITVPESVKVIDMAAFRNCSKLKSITISNKVKTVGVLSFDGCHSELKIYGMDNSYIKDFAKENLIKFEKLDLEINYNTLAVGQSEYIKMNSNALCEWKSSNKLVAEVNSKGKVKAISKGKATVTANIYGKSFTCEVEVK